MHQFFGTIMRLSLPPQVQLKIGRNMSGKCPQVPHYVVYSYEENTSTEICSEGVTNVQDYYRTLGVGRSASEQDIKQAYRKLARQYHPDVNPNDKRAEARFKEINEAYEVLSDKEKRQKYDRFGADWQRYEQVGGYGGGVGGNPFGGGVRGSGPGPNFSDIFDVFFGSGGRAGVSGYPGVGNVGGTSSQTIEQQVDISLEEAFTGTQRTLQLNGLGNTPRTIKVKIPAGADTGTRVRIAGEGRITSAGVRGDLFLVVNVQPHPRFSREGEDLQTNLPVDLYTLLLGGDVRLPTLENKTLSLSVPADTPNGKVFRLSGQGMPLLNSTNRGALYVALEAVLPNELSVRERELFERLRRMRGGD